MKCVLSIGRNVSVTPPAKMDSISFWMSAAISMSGATELNTAWGHTTALYTKVATRTVRAVISPLDKLGIVTPGEAHPAA